MFLVFLIIGVVIMVCLSSAFNKEESTPAPSPARPTSPPVKRFDKNDPYDICCALACLATAVGYYNSDACCYLDVYIYNEKTESIIHASFSPGVNLNDKSMYRNFFIPDDIASLLSAIPFTTTSNGGLEVKFSRCIGTNRTMEKIREGISMVDGKPYTCTLKSYHPGNDPTQTHITYTAAD